MKPGLNLGGFSLIPERDSPDHSLSHGRYKRFSRDRCSCGSNVCLIQGLFYECPKCHQVIPRGLLRVKAFRVDNHE